jgi:uncharacterized membrane protein
LKFALELKVKNISHKFIDTLSDGVFSIAITLLGLDVVGLVSEISKSEDFNAALFSHWPTFLSYVLGFLVLFTMWYSYHVTSQYVEGTNAFIVWNHGFTMAWVALMPFGVALLAENLSTPNRKWGVFYFGICLFGQYWTSTIQVALKGFKFEINFTPDLPVPADVWRKFMPIFFTLTSVIGIVLVGISLINPWVALAGYAIFILGNTRPVKSLARLGKTFERFI